MKEQLKKKLAAAAPDCAIYFNEPMKKHTTFRVGGPADILIQADEKSIPEIIKLCRQENEPYYVIGNGSNLLVSDKGIRGVVIEMTRPIAHIQVKDDTITVQAGALLSKIADTAAGFGLSGMEFASGIPGTIGGAVVMNAGAYGGEMKDIVEKVFVLSEDGVKMELTGEQLQFDYRRSCILEKHYIITNVVLKLAFGKEDEIRSKMKELNEKRVEKQPLSYPSAGSTFKRPNGYFAGKLIMDAGLCGFSVGGAQVSEKHCGFVINKGDATAEDVRNLMQYVTEEVHKQFGVVLEPEVKFIGEF